MPKKTKKPTLEALLTNETPVESWGSYHLPVHTLPEVQRREREEFKRLEPGVIKKIGGLTTEILAGTALVLSNPHLLLREGDKNERSFRTGEGINFIGRIASRYLIKRDQRAEQKDQNRLKSERRAVKSYRESNPEVEAREAKLMARAANRERKQVLSNTLVNLARRTNSMTDYIKQKNTYSFSKNIPRRSKSFDPQSGFDGSYSELAKGALTEATRYRQEDGTIPLLGWGVQRARLQEQATSDKPINEIINTEDMYSGGVATALWQLGFVEFKSEERVSYGEGSFNPDISWDGNTGYGLPITASLELDSDNELHQLLIPKDSTFDNPMIELEMLHDRSPGGDRNAYMNLRVVEARSAELVA